MLDYLIVFKVTKPRRFQNLFEILKNYILCQFVVSMCPLLTVYKVIEVSRRQGKGMKLLVIYSTYLIPRIILNVKLKNIYVKQRLCTCSI